MEGAPTFESAEVGEGGWQGDWDKGDRPEGYWEVDRRYASLRKLGFRSTETLGSDFVSKYNELTTRAKSGSLNDQEMAQLMECYQQLNQAMDKYEEWYESRPKAD